VKKENGDEADVGDFVVTLRHGRVLKLASGESGLMCGKWRRDKLISH